MFFVIIIITLIWTTDIHAMIGMYINEDHVTKYWNTTLVQSQYEKYSVNFIKTFGKSPEYQIMVNVPISTRYLSIIFDACFGILNSEQIINDTLKIENNNKNQEKDDNFSVKHSGYANIGANIVLTRKHIENILYLSDNTDQNLWPDEQIFNYRFFIKIARPTYNIYITRNIFKILSRFISVAMPHGFLATWYENKTISFGFILYGLYFNTHETLSIIINDANRTLAKTIRYRVNFAPYISISQNIFASKIGLTVVPMINYKIYKNIYTDIPNRYEKNMQNALGGSLEITAYFRYKKNFFMALNYGLYSQMRMICLSISY